jgi:hypothetical protein
LIPSRYHWDQLDAKLIVLDINFPVRNISAKLPGKADGQGCRYAQSMAGEIGQ